MKKRLLLIIIVLLLSLLAAGCKSSVHSEYDTNLLNNSGFESELFEYWSKDVWVQIEGFTEIDVVTDEGSSVLKIQSNDLNDAKMRQTVAVEEKEIYKLSGYIKAQDGAEGKGANLSFENMFYYTEELFDTNGEYRYVELYGKTAKGQKDLTVFVRLGGYSNESKGIAYFDDIRLEKVKEAPAGVPVYNFQETEPKKETEPEDENAVKFAGLMALISILFIIIFIMIKQSLDYGHALEKDNDDKLYMAMFGIVLLIGLLIRAILAVTVDGYPNDIGCWMGWAHAAAEKGIAGLYDGSTFIDYPPGYMYILYVIGWLNKVPFLMQSAAAVVKIPPILADVALAIIIYKLAKTKLSGKAAVLLASLYYLSPAIITTSAAWGQIDSLLALMVVGYLIFLNKRNFIAAGAFLGAGVLIKPQMGFFVFAYVAAIVYHMRDAGWKKALVEFAKGTAAGIGAFVIISLPLIVNYGLKFVIDMYVTILTSYSSVSLNACNIWPLFGGMWEGVDTPFLGLTYGTWGYIGMIVSILIFFVVSIRDKKQNNIFFHAALLVTGIFMLSGKMHERYMYPAMALLLISYIYTKDRRHFALFGLFTVTQFANISLVLANQYIFGISLDRLFVSMAEFKSLSDWLGHYGMNLWTTVISWTALAGYVYMIYVSLKPVNKTKQQEFDRMYKEERQEAAQHAEQNLVDEINGKEYGGLFKSLGKNDYIIMGILMLVYSVAAFVHLGNIDGPESMWNVNMSQQEVIVDFGNEVEIDKIMFFRGQGTNGAHFTVDFADLNQEDAYQSVYYYRIDEESTLANLREQIIQENNMDEIDSAILFSNYPAIFKWYTMSSPYTARYARITVHRPMLRLVEMAFVDAEGNVIPVENVIIADESAKEAMNLFDEQETVPQKETYMNSTYFDEIYHAGTAWEHIMRYNPYETTHPPLGKVIIGIGIKIFGMNPFGWRVMGTLTGILMIPVMYLLGLLVLEKRRYAFIAAFLMTFDFMHFTQTRIATIDSYGVFFIMLMFLFMGIYYRMSFFKTPFVKTLVPLALAGIFFGLGVASKWIALYAGAGLAVVFFYTLYRRYREYTAAMQCHGEDCPIDEDRAEHIRGNFKKYVWITLALCIVFFIVIPILIYTASYIPTLQAEEGRDLGYVLDAQKYMFNYHSGLNEEHPFASPWYEWPLIIKPMWYYSDGSLYNTGRMTSIAALGNPAIWWVGTLAFIWLLWHMFSRWGTDKMQVFILIGFLAQYLPWILVPRSMFIYHYFASVPFIIIMITMMIKNIEKRRRHPGAGTYAYLGIVLILFVMFYPVIAGVEISSQYGHFLQWIDTWWFIY